jgi:uncharacterized peroxidase-related enzyme
MSRIPIVDPATATGDARRLLHAVQSQLGVTPNFIRVLATSPKALEGFLGLYSAVGAFTLDKAMQERIALAVAEANGCRYCVSAHTAIGRHAGLSNDEMLRNRVGRAGNIKAEAVLAFALATNENIGEVTSADFDAAREAGISDAEVIEIIAVVALNVFTNLLNKATDVEIDFPEVALLDRSLRAAA